MPLGLKAAGLDALYGLSLTAAAVIAAICFGDRIERHPKGSHPLLSRESILSAAALAGSLLAGYIAPETALRQAGGKADILIFILSFGVISYGIKQSGFFRYAALRTVNFCNGDRNQIVLGLFLLTSLLTYLTSNDIVTLTMTPVVLEAARQNGIKDARLLLISQYIAANTLSMGLMIGSPTNLIVSQAGRINFVQYAVLMAKPTLAAAATSIMLLTAAVRLTTPGARRPEKPAGEPENAPEFSQEMAVWIAVFLATAAAAGLISWQEQPLFWVTLPAAAVSLLLLRSKFGTAEAGRCIGSLPWSIVPFAAAFFAIAGAIAGELPLERIFRQAGEMPEAVGAAAVIAGTGLLVNLFNDLPAAALLSEALPERTILLQAMLASLNIACYVTPTGALAGIIWFHLLRQEKEIRTPDRAGLTLWGATAFLTTGAGLSLILSL